MSIRVCGDEIRVHGYTVARLIEVGVPATVTAALVERLLQTEVEEDQKIEIAQLNDELNRLRAVIEAMTAAKVRQ
jgi:Na+-transporting methylmalonyl-CoA/oxaloacetate decarboxylase gamma subunit